MSEKTPALDGTTYAQARSFAFAFNAAGGASVDKAIDAGSYHLFAAGADCVAVVGVGAQTAAALPATQPAAGSPNKHLYCPAGVKVPLDVDASGARIAALGAAAGTGTLNVIGPVGRTIHG